MGCANPIFLLNPWIHETLVRGCHAQRGLDRLMQAASRSCTDAHVLGCGVRKPDPRKRARAESLDFQAKPDLRTPHALDHLDTSGETHV